MCIPNCSNISPFPIFSRGKNKKTKNFHQNFHTAEGTDHDQVAKDTAGPGRCKWDEILDSFSWTIQNLVLRFPVWLSITSTHPNRDSYWFKSGYVSLNSPRAANFPLLGFRIRLDFVLHFTSYLSFGMNVPALDTHIYSMPGRPDTFRICRLRPYPRHRRSVSEKRKILQIGRYQAKKNNKAGTDANGMTSGKFWRNSASRFDVGWSHGVTPRFRFAQSAPVPVPKIAWSGRNSSCFSRKFGFSQFWTQKKPYSNFQHKRKSK